MTTTNATRRPMTTSRLWYTLGYVEKQQTMKLEFTNSCREVVSVALYHQQHTITTDSLRLLVATAINQAHRLHSNKGCNHQQHMITTDSLRLLVATAINQAHRLHSSTQRMLKEAIYTVKVIFYAKIISFLLCCSHTTTEQSRQTVHITLSTMSAGGQIWWAARGSWRPAWSCEL